MNSTHRDILTNAVPHKFSTGKLTAETRLRQDSTYKDGNKYDYVVIGSGMAGLTSAALLSNAGYRVCVLEAHDVPGGYVHSFKYPTKYGDFSFCAQVHYIWGCHPGGHVYEFLKKIGLQDEITFELFGPDGYDRMVMPDGKKVFIPYGFDKLAENIERVYPGQGQGVYRFTKILERIREEVRKLPDHDIRWWEYVTKGWNFRNLWWYKNKTLQDVFNECDLSKEAQAILIAQAGDFMAPPEELSIFAYTGLFGGYNTGAYYPTKHFNHFIQKIVDFIVQHEGCHIYFETPVSEVNVRDDKVISVETEDGKLFTADKYICNIDPKLASYMIGREKFSNDYLSRLDYEYSHTGLIVYLGLHGIDLRDFGFGSFNTWHLEDWDMNEIWRKSLLGDYSKPWVFLSTPTLHSFKPGIAPPDCHILEVETLADYDHFQKFLLKGRKAYLEEKFRVASRILQIAKEKYIPQLNKHIALKLVGSPITNQSFCRAPKGNAYGSHLTPKNMSLNRLKSDTPFSNFFWCNASSGYGGVCPTIGTGNALYKRLTGDIFYKPEDAPSDKELVKRLNTVEVV